MSFVTIENRKLKFDAQHDQVEKTITRNGKDCVVRGSTRVVILDQDDKMVGAGVSFCSARDQFVRKEGFKRALKRALQDAKMNREQRTVVWNHFGRKG